MNRFPFKHFYLITKMLIAGLLLASMVVVAQPTTRPTTKRPNVVLIYADDIGYGDLSCYAWAKKGI